MDYRETFYSGYWLEITEFNRNGSEKSFSRISTFKHGCKYFDVIASQDQMPSHYIYRLIEKHCPMDISNSIVKNMETENRNTSVSFDDDHEVNILI